MRREESDGMFKLVVGLAVLLAAVILYYAGRRFVSALAKPAQPETPVARPAPADAPKTETPAAYLPPIKLLRIEGRRAPKRESPPAVPKPPVTPKDKK